MVVTHDDIASFLFLVRALASNKKRGKGGVGNQPHTSLTLSPFAAGTIPIDT